MAMAYAEISRPASGLEHYFSHMWEMMALERGVPYDLHGIQVGVGTVLSMKLYRKIRQIQPDRAKAEAHMKAFSRADWEAQVRRIFGKTADEIIAIEDKTHKNDPARHAKRLDNLVNHWDEILKIIDEELPWTTTPSTRPWPRPACPCAPARSTCPWTTWSTPLSARATSATNTSPAPSSGISA